MTQVMIFLFASGFLINIQTAYCQENMYDLAATTAKEEGVKYQLPKINQKVVAFCHDRLGKKVGNGQCSDLVFYALRNSGAKTWSSEDDGYGRQLDPMKDTILKGDILRFRDAVFHTKYSKRKVKNHKAVIINVLPDQHYVIAHQNVNNVLKVRMDTYDLSNVVKGIYFYRPLKAN